MTATSLLLALILLSLGAIVIEIVDEARQIER